VTASKNSDGLNCSSWYPSRLNCQHSVWSEPNVAIHTWSKVNAEKRKVRIRNLHTNRHTHTQPCTLLYCGTCAVDLRKQTRCGYCQNKVTRHIHSFPPQSAVTNESLGWPPAYDVHKSPYAPHIGCFHLVNRVVS